jgi:hypothetical protein
MIKAEYKTLADLKKAMDEGKVSKDVVVRLDNDCASISIEDEKAEFGVRYLWWGDYSCACAEQALDALGIKWEHV